MMKDSQWVLPASALLLCQHAALLCVSRATRSTMVPPTFSYALVAFILSLIGAVGILLWKMRNVSLFEMKPNWREIAAYLIGFQLLGLQITALTWGKEMIPLVFPYWADPAIANAERALLGVDAWRLIPSFAVAPLDSLYPSWAVVKFGALLTVLVMPPSAFKSRAMLSYFLTVGIVGVFGQYLMPSVGPALFDQIHGGTRFLELRERLHEHAPIVTAATTYLWNGYAKDGLVFGGGISAMPSMHVATTTWVALVISSAFPRLKVFLWTFWAVIFAGSFALGWHYALDGVVGTAGAIMFWKLAAKLLRTPSIGSPSKSPSSALSA